MSSMTPVTVAASLAPPSSAVLDALPRARVALVPPAHYGRPSSLGALAAALRAAQPVPVSDQVQLANALMQGRSVIAPAGLVRQALNPYANGSLVAKVASSDRSSSVAVGNVSLGGTMCSSANAAVIITPGPRGSLVLTPTSLLAKHGHWSSSYLLVSGGAGPGPATRSPMETSTLRALLDAEVFPAPFRAQ